jgi:hypothetical protein
MVREIKTRKTKFIEKKAMEMKNSNFISAVKKKSCWFYDSSIVLADTMSNTKKQKR